MFIGNYTDYLSCLKDLNEGRDLEDIPACSNKVLSLIIRNKYKICNAHDCAQILGSLQLLRGLEYHYENFLSHLRILASKDCLGDDSALDHEAVAYLNRLGQFYYFAKSLKLLSDCPRIKKLYLFRRKHTGHRSIDFPCEDLQHEQIWQAGCFLRRIFAGKIDPDFDPDRDLNNDMGFWLTPARYLSDKAFISYQILSNGAHATFIPQQDHSIVLKEIEGVYMRLFEVRR